MSALYDLEGKASFHWCMFFCSTSEDDDLLGVQPAFSRQDIGHVDEKV